jgi:hypothetical protein
MLLSSNVLASCLALVVAAACSQTNGNERPAASQTNTVSSPQTSATPGAPNMPSNAAPPNAGQPASIGTATMKDDGTIVLMLRATGPGGMLGDSRMEYPKGHPNYEEVLKHLGGLKPGEQKPVPPWP